MIKFLDARDRCVPIDEPVITMTVMVITDEANETV